MVKLAQYLLAISATVLFVFIIYRPALDAPFLFDDLPNIVDNRTVHLDEFSPPKLARLKKGIGHNRPLARLTFAFNYYFGQLDPFGYHLLNLIIHIMAAAALYGLTFLTLSLPRLKDSYPGLAHPVAALSSLLFVFHPVNAQLVSYTVQRMASMACLFFLLTLLLYLLGRQSPGQKRRIYWGLAGLSAVCAFTSKENSATLPLFIFLYELYFFPKTPRQRRIIWLLLALPPALAAYYTRFDFSKLLVSSTRVSHIPYSQHLLTQLRAISYYLSLFFYPHPGRLNLDYDFAYSSGLFSPPSTFLSLLLLLGIIALGLYLARRRPFVSLAIAWFLGNLAIESGLVLADTVFEHRLYLPGIGILWLISLGLLTGWKRLFPQDNIWKKRGGVLALLTLLGLLGGWTYQRNLVWANELSLWQDTAQKSPRKARPHLSLGAAYAHQKRYQEAIAEYKLALKLRPDYAKAYYNLGLAMEKQGQKGKAIDAYQQAVKFKPNYGEAHNNLGGLYLEQGRFQEAEKEFLVALRLKPEFIEIRANLATIYSKQGQLERAIQEYLAVLKARPTVGEAHYNLAMIYLKKPYRDYSRARYHLIQALRLRPKQPPQAAIRQLLEQVQQRLEAVEQSP